MQKSEPINEETNSDEQENLISNNAIENTI